MTDEEKNQYINSSPDAEYRMAYASYQKDLAEGSLSRVEKLKRENELQKLQVGARYSKDVREVYGLSKGDDLMGLLQSDGTGQLAQQILAYDDALVAAGVIAKNKFRDKYGNPTFDTAAKTASGRKGSKKATGSGVGVKIAKMIADAQSAPTYKKSGGGTGNASKIVAISKGANTQLRKSNKPTTVKIKQVA